MVSGGQRHTPTLSPQECLPVGEGNIKTDIQGTVCEDMD